MMASKHNSMTKLRKAQIVYRKQKSDKQDEEKPSFVWEIIISLCIAVLFVRFVLGALFDSRISIPWLF